MVDTNVIVTYGANINNTFIPNLFFIYCCTFLYFSFITYPLICTGNIVNIVAFFVGVKCYRDVRVCCTAFILFLITDVVSNPFYKY